MKKLPHFRDLDARFAYRVPLQQQTPEQIYQILIDKGAPETCYVMGNHELDGLEIDLRKALNGIVDMSWGVFLSCISGKLGYFGGEGPNERYILER